MAVSEKVIVVLAVATLFCQACARRAWYEGFQEAQRQQCYKSPNQSDVRSCLDRVNGTTYDDYLKSRESPREQAK